MGHSLDDLPKAAFRDLPTRFRNLRLAVEKFEDEVIDSACGTGSLLVASLERRRMLLGGATLRELYKKALETGRPILEMAGEVLLSRAHGLDALKPACFITALNLRIATWGVPLPKLSIHHVSVGEDGGGSLNMLLSDELPEPLRTVAERKYDVVIMNPPFTRSDRV